VRADLNEVPFTSGSFDAVVALYSITHTPAGAQASVIAGARRVLRPGGWFLATFSAGGSGDWRGEWLGTNTFFGSNDPDANRSMLSSAGFTIVRDEIAVLHEPEGDARFHWVLAGAPERGSAAS